MATVTPAEFCVGDCAYRTNNHVESFHRIMNSRIKAQAPIDVFLEEMKTLCMHQLNNYLSHFVPPRLSIITANLEQSLTKLRNGRIALDDFLLLDFNERIQ